MRLGPGSVVEEEAKIRNIFISERSEPNSGLGRWNRRRSLHHPFPHQITARLASLGDFFSCYPSLGKKKIGVCRPSLKMPHIIPEKRPADNTTRLILY